MFYDHKKLAEAIMHRRYAGLGDDGQKIKSEGFATGGEVEGDSDSGKMLAAEEILKAIHSADKTKLAAALENFYSMCDDADDSEDRMNVGMGDGTGSNTEI